MKKISFKEINKIVTRVPENPYMSSNGGDYEEWISTYEVHGIEDYPLIFTAEHTSCDMVNDNFGQRLELTYAPSLSDEEIRCLSPQDYDAYYIIQDDIRQALFHHRGRVELIHPDTEKRAVEASDF